VRRFADRHSSLPLTAPPRSLPPLAASGGIG
jgi:hypothetical protein